MSAALAVPAPFMYSFDDRAVGAEGQALRDLLEDARPQSSTEDRAEEIYARAQAAINSASEHDVLVDVGTFQHAIDFLAALPAEIPLPDVVVENGSEIGLDWDEGAHRVLSLTVRDTPLIGFAGLFGVEPIYGKLDLASQNSETLRFLFGRLYPECSRSTEADH